MGKIWAVKVKLGNPRRGVVPLREIGSHRYYFIYHTRNTLKIYFDNLYNFDY